ncbi:MAG TPA: HAMP domain-containing sensor histidine kinase [Longimicrobium sp.]|jgi:signal transduction histidine kinase|nr:HAMP domain-containing sensor histidine kinase [Longimicrobium sp.]
MIRLRRSPHLAPGSAFLAGLLLALLGLSAVLAYQAAAAARSEAASTDRALRGYASFATWELARRADEVLHRRLAASLQAALGGELPAGALPPAAAALEARAARVLAWCGCARPLRGAFVVTVRGGVAAVDVAGASPAVERWLSSGAPGSALARPRGDTTVVEAVTVGGERYDLVARLRRSATGAAAEGFLVSPADVAPAALGQAYRSSALLPGVVRGSVPAGEAVAAVVLSADGTAVWRSRAAAAARDGWVDAKVGGFPQEPLAPGTVTERLDGLLAGLSSRVAVRADAAGAVPAGGPKSRLPLLLTVFGLALGLVSVAIVQLRRQQELVRLRDDFVSGVSHELRTPLAQIRLFADLLESGRLATGEQRSRSIRIINEESRRLTWLVENILHFSRAQRGAGRIAPQPVEAAPLVREIVDAFAPLARERDARFEVAADEGVVVRVDAGALRQVLLNLLDNAVKYGPPGQTVRVRLELRGLALRLSVDDRGPGVPWEERGRVWEPYRRLARDAEGATGGSGIGLAVVKDLVELHGGRVGVGEAPGGGARFWIELPYAMHAGPPSEDAVDAAVPARAVAR